MKKSLLSIVVFVSSIIFLFFTHTDSSSVDAKEKDSNDSLNIESLEDGRVAPAENAKNLNEEELNQILIEIGHSMEDINHYPIDLKQEFVELGGMKVEPDSEEVDHKLIIDDEESEEVGTLASCKPSDTNGNCSDGDWNGSVNLFKIGETSSQYQYIVQYRVHWEQTPFFTFKDKIGVHWGAFGQPVSGTAYGEGSAIDPVGDTIYFSMPMDLSSNYGFTGEYRFPCPDQTCRVQGRFGSMHEQINISKNQYKPGEQLTISAHHIHPHLPNNLSLSVALGGVSVSGLPSQYDEWTWRANFTLN
ncbi:hypothetical protein MKY30_11100 [Oceanobacillus sp. FSL W8-0428]|uniref:hypothetical protein n=1 Tax=Oceanobacillus TaxID=182709 RepID=UPI0012EECEBC